MQRRVAVTPGSRFGSYELAALIGVGGMGEVYQARDTKLGRDVALKILPDAFAQDPDRLARFQREAQILASLNHPNIAAIYGLEDGGLTGSGQAAKALILELVEGPTLADRLARGRIPVDEALPIAKQIADALEAAHEAGIVHRDLKPANIKVRRDGTVKVLDFGIAKAVAGGSAATSSHEAQGPLAATEIGAIIGTPGYMSPEQARGNPVDQRTDIWAFGCVLFEILTGRAPFHGDTTADALAHVIDGEPRWEALPSSTPPAIATLLHRCLAKNPQERLPHIGAARFEIADAIKSKVIPRASSSIFSRETVRFVSAGVALLLIVVVFGWLGLGRDAPNRAPLTVSRVAIDASPGESWVIHPHDPDLAISPDGERIAYIGRRANRNELVVRRLDQFEGLALGTFGGAVRHPFFSPDGKWLGFVDGGVLKKAAVDGSGTATVCVLPGYMSGATWGADNVITFGTLNTGLFRVSSAGGKPEPVATEAQRNGQNARWPETLPGGKAMLFSSVGGDQGSEIRVRSLVTGEERVVVRSATFPRYASTGHLLYVAQGSLWGVRFDVERLETVGDAEPIVDGVMIKGPPQTGFGAADVAIAANGTLVYRPSGTSERGSDTLVWVDRDGREEPLNLQAGAYGRMQLSRDGSKIAIEVSDVSLSNTDIWVGDVRGTALAQLTFDAALDEYPVWTPDGEHVIFRSSREPSGLYSKRADATSPEKSLLRVEGRPTPYFVARDGSDVVYMRGAELSRGYFGLRLDGAGEERPLSLVPGPVAAIAPNGQWMAYSSEETGNFEVYVQPYPNPSGVKWKVTTGGGRDPLWSHDGNELFYQNDTTTFSVAVTTGQAFAAAPPVALFEGPYVDALGRWYDAAPDGRFLMIKPGWLNAAREAPLYVVLNWFEELNARLPRE